jgi:CelD/BcsL family acetyltransferase involved in cellulose biosynthesis
MAASFDVETIAISDLSEQDRTAWLDIRRTNPALESPYHHPDYHVLADAYQGGGKLTIARRDGELVAALPWQGGRFARPSGAPLSDYQSLICAAGTNIDVSNILANQAVGAFHYSAMPSDDGQETCRMEITTPEAWRKARDGSYRRHLKSTRRRIRKAEEEFGSRRIVTQSQDPDAYEGLIRWKRDKFKETDKFDVLDNPGTSGLLRALWDRGPEHDLRADLHVLYFGDRLAACDLGLTDGHVFHSWIVGYDPELISYAPGIQLLEGLIDETPMLGYKVIDLGPGLEGYKRHYGTHPHHVSSGLITLASPSGLMAATYDTLERHLGDATGDLLGKLRRRYSQIAACEPRFSRRSAAMAQAFKGHFRQSEA